MLPQLEQFMLDLKELDLSFAYISQPQTVAYLTGFESDPHERVLALLVFPNAEPFLFTPVLDAEDARNSGWTYPIYSYRDHEQPYKLIASHMITGSSHARGGFEKDHLPVGRYEALQAEIGFSQGIDLTPVLQNRMVIKTESELQKMHAAGDWADQAIDIGVSVLKEGITEIEVVAEIEYELKKRGCEGMSFSTEVLFGEHAASPHGVPGERPLKKGELVLFDLGCIHEGYMSDMTRTFAFGTPTTKAKEMYDIVLNAHQTAIAAVKPGVTAGDIDQAAREIIENAGYGDFFTHRTGHGIGKSIHEFPNIMQGNDLILKEGMCFSVEPGIYLPDEAGVRIEDCLVVTKDGSKLFTHTPTEYKEINKSTD